MDILSTQQLEVGFMVLKDYVKVQSMDLPIQ